MSDSNKFNNIELNFEKFLKDIVQKEQQKKVVVQPDDEIPVNKKINARYRNNYIDVTWIGPRRYQ